MQSALLPTAASDVHQLVPSEPEQEQPPPRWKCFVVSNEAQTHWECNYIFRTIVLGLHFSTLLLVTAMLIFPSAYSGCATFAGTFPSLLVCTFLPACMWITNWMCNRKKRSKAETKLVLLSVMLLYYLTITISDSMTRIMVILGSVSPRGPRV